MQAFNLPLDCINNIVSYFNIFDLLCLQFTSIELRLISKKTLKCKKYSPEPDRQDEFNLSFEISNAAAQYGITTLRWISTLFKLSSPGLSYAKDVETIKFIKSRIIENIDEFYYQYLRFDIYAFKRGYREGRRTKREFANKININCHNLDVLTWMVDNKIYEFIPSKVIDSGYYDILEKCDLTNGIYPDYNIICWQIDNNKLLKYNNYATAVFLVGGGKSHIMGQSLGDNGHSYDEAKWFKCRNVGSERLLHAIKNNVEINECVFTSAVEANNIDALNILKPYFVLEEYDIENLFDVAINEDHYETIKWIIENYDISRQRQLSCSNIKILEYLKMKGFVWDASTYLPAIENEDLDIIKYLYDKGVPWICEKMNYSICCRLIMAGNVSIMKWCLFHGVLFHYDHNNDYFIQPKNLEMMIYITNLGWKPTASTIKANKYNLKNIKWLTKNHNLDKESLHKNVNSGYRNFGSYEVHKWVDEIPTHINNLST